MSDDDDDDDLFGDFEREDEQLEVAAISSNLLNDIGVEADHVVHQGDVDEGLITWVAPKFSGLENSNAVGASTHWYREEEDEKMWDALLEDEDETDEGMMLSENLLATTSEQTEGAPPALPTPPPVSVAPNATARSNRRERRLSENLIELPPSPAPAPKSNVRERRPSVTVIFQPEQSGDGDNAMSRGPGVDYVPSSIPWLLDLQRSLFGASDAPPAQQMPVPNVTATPAQAFAMR